MYDRWVRQASMLSVASVQYWVGLVEEGGLLLGSVLHGGVVAMGKQTEERQWIEAIAE